MSLQAVDMVGLARILYEVRNKASGGAGPWKTHDVIVKGANSRFENHLTKARISTTAHGTREVITNLKRVSMVPLNGLRVFRSVCS
jgi:hypothetical protein